MTLPVYVTRSCNCTAPKGMGYPRPDFCDCGNRFVTEKEKQRSVGVGVGDAHTSGVDSSATKGGDADAPQRAVHTAVTGAALGTSGGGSEDFKGKPRRRSGLKRTRRKESKAERAARHNFNDKVKARACWFRWHRPCERCNGTGEEHGQQPPFSLFVCSACGGDGKHHCEGRKDAHHLVPKQFLRKRFQAVLPEDRFVAILFNPKIGAPLCRKAHDRIESGADRIYWEDLTDECIEYVFSLPDFVALRLEEESPKRATAEQVGGLSG